MANRAIPVIIQLVVFYLVISWLVRLARRRRDAQAPPAQPQIGKPRPAALSSASPPRPEPPPQPGGVERSRMMFNGVRWDVIRRPHRNPSSEPGSPRHDFYVEEPPRCPKCGLGVVETQSWLGYTWSCPECGLRKRSSQSTQAVARALARGLH